MEILFNQDGSLLKFVPNGSIQQGNDGVDKIVVGVVGLDYSNYQAVANFQLPNGDTTSKIITESDTIHYETSTYPALSFYLSSNETLFAGRLLMSISFVNLNQTLFTWTTTLIVNKTPFNPDEVNITYSEYNNLVKAIENKLVSPYPETVVVNHDDVWDREGENYLEFKLREYKGKCVKINLAQMNLDENMEFFGNNLAIYLELPTGSITVAITQIDDSNFDYNYLEVDSWAFDVAYPYTLLYSANHATNIIGSKNIYIDLTTPIVKIIVRTEEN